MISDLLHFVWQTVPGLLGLGTGVLVIVFFIALAVYSVARYFVWPYLCDFGNWLGRP